MEDFPKSLKKPMGKLDWCQLPIPDPHKPDCSDWSPLPSKEDLPQRPAPQGWLSAVRPSYRSAASARVESFRKKLTLWLKGCSERPLSVVIPGEWLEHWVFEAPHEFHSCPGFRHSC